MATRSASTLFGGHPRGLAVLALTEMWERFSYYGMTALLALYMTQQLLLPGHAEHVAGLAALRRLFEFRGAMSDTAFAALTYGWYGGLVYFTPIIGGILADRWLGAKRTVTLGALLMAGGHLAMTFDQSFLLALLMLVLGSGCLKGNITTQVGTLYPEAAESLRERGYAIFSTGINIGATMGPLASAGLAAAYGWHAGFALSAALMLLALAIYLGGQRHLPDLRKPRVEKAARVALSQSERRRIAVLVCVMVLTVPAIAAFFLSGGIGMIWLDHYVDLSSPLGTVPAGWFNSINNVASVLIAPLLIALWGWQARHGREPGAITKIAIGSALMGLANMMFAVGSALAPEPGSVPVIWAVLGYAGAGIGFMWFWPVLLALVSNQAPVPLKSTMMGVTFLSLFVGSIVAGWVSSFYDGMSPAAFWTLNSAIPATAALLALALRRPLTRRLNGVTST